MLLEPIFLGIWSRREDKEGTDDCRCIRALLFWTRPLCDGVRLLGRRKFAQPRMDDPDPADSVWTLSLYEGKVGTEDCLIIMLRRPVLLPLLERPVSFDRLELLHDLLIIRSPFCASFGVCLSLIILEVMDLRLLLLLLRLELTLLLELTLRLELELPTDMVSLSSLPPLVDALPRKDRLLDRRVEECDLSSPLSLDPVLVKEPSFVGLSRRGPGPCLVSISISPSVLARIAMRSFIFSSSLLRLLG